MSKEQKKTKATLKERSPKTKHMLTEGTQAHQEEPMGPSMGAKPHPFPTVAITSSASKPSAKIGSKRVEFTTH